MDFGFSLGTATVLRIEGKDRCRILNNVATQDLRTPLSQGVYETFITEGKGRTLGHGLVLAFEDSLWYATVPDQAERLIAHIDRFVIREDVRLVDCSSACRFYLFSNSQIVSRTLQVEVPSIEASQSISIRDGAGREWTLLHCPWLGGESVLGIAGSASDIRSIEESTGAPLIASDFVTRHGWESLRIQNFWPWYGVDFDDKNLPQEIARDGQAISFRKGCYLGQETVARLDAMGQVQKKLVQLHIEGTQAVSPDTPIHAGEAQVGTLTSSAWDERSQRVVAMAFVKRSHFGVGKELTIDGRSATVVR